MMSPRHDRLPTPGWTWPGTSGRGQPGPSESIQPRRPPELSGDDHHHFFIEAPLVNVLDQRGDEVVVPREPYLHGLRQVPVDAVIVPIEPCPSRAHRAACPRYERAPGERRLPPTAAPATRALRPAVPVPRGLRFAFQVEGLCTGPW